MLSQVHSQRLSEVGASEGIAITQCRADFPTRNANQKFEKEIKENTDVIHTWSLYSILITQIWTADYFVTFAYSPASVHTAPCCFQLALLLATSLHLRSHFWSMLWQPYTYSSISSSEKITHFLNSVLFRTIHQVQSYDLLKPRQKPLVPARPPSSCSWLTETWHLP